MSHTKNLVISSLLLAAVGAVVALVIPGNLAMHEPEPLRRGPGVTQISPLSTWFPELKGSRADTNVYILDSGKPGGSALVLGGTHGNEPAGYMTAILMLEHATPSAGKLFVIPFANASAMTHTDYMEGTPKSFLLNAASGPRRFRFGSRATSPMDQWPDPDIYIHASSGQKLSGSETRNLNRAYPGRKDGTFTERLAYGITRLITTEKIDLAVDLHEASPEYPVINAIVAHDRAMPIASMAVLNLEMDGITIGLEPSPVKLRGLSHRELGDATNTLALLMESTNPAQGRLRGKTHEALIRDGQDPLYVKAHQLGRTFVPFDDKGWPLKLRVGRHLAGLQGIFAAWTAKTPEKPLVVGALPTYDELLSNGLEAYF